MINYTNPDRECFVNIAAMALFNVPANEEVTVVDIIDKLRSHYQIIVAADYYPNICCYYPYIRTTQYVPKRISNKALVNHLAEMKPNICVIPFDTFGKCISHAIFLAFAYLVYTKTNDDALLNKILDNNANDIYVVKHFMDVDIIPIKNFITSALTHVDLQQVINVYLK